MSGPKAQRSGTHRRHWEYDWVEVRADEVREGDLYANGATVTESRPYDAEIDGNYRPAEWTIRCGESFATYGNDDRPVVVGRNARRRES